MSKLGPLLIIIAITLLVSCSREHARAGASTVESNSTRQIIDVRFSSKSLGKTLWYRAIIPSRSSAERLPVLYFLHGANSDPEEVTQMSRVADLAVGNRIVVIIPFGEFSYYTNAKHRSHAAWEDAITEDLRQDVESRFSVDVDPKRAGIAGNSMGGYGAAKIALKHPERYKFAGVLSGALEITQRPPSLPRWGQTLRIWTIFGYTKASRADEDVFVLSSHASPGTKWFVSCGNVEPLYNANSRFAEKLKRLGIDPKFVTVSGDHDWTNWNQALPLLFAEASKAL